MQVLIVEDDEMIAMVVEEVLTENKHLVLHRAASLAEAEAWLPRYQELDLVLLDNYLGDGEGIELLPRLTRPPADDQHAPVVMVLSANDNQEFLSDCFDKGASDYLVKPFNAGLLALKVNALLREKQLMGELSRKNRQLGELLAESAREEELAQFTYDFLVARNRDKLPGVDWRTESSRAFSGDLLLQHRAPDGKALLMLVDATGHGLSAAITLLPVVYTFHAMAKKGLSLESLLFEINERLLNDTPEGRFVCAVLMEIDPASQRLRIWNGGMPAVWQIDEKGRKIGQVDSAHMPLGVLPKSSFDVATHDQAVDAPQRWFAYSDGITEQANDQQECYGRERLLRSVQRGGADPVPHVMGDLQAFRGERKLADDASCLIVDPLAYIEHQASHGRATGRPTGCDGFTPFQASLKLQGRRAADTPPVELARSLMVGAHFDELFMQRFCLIVTELITNAVDHGLLRLDSTLKEAEGGFLAYAEERQRRLQCLDSNAWMAISVEGRAGEQAPEIVLAVEDSGAGFDKALEPDAAGALDSRVYGRGLGLVNRYCKELTIVPPGNQVVAVLPSG